MGVHPIRQRTLNQARVVGEALALLEAATRRAKRAKRPRYVIDEFACEYIDTKTGLRRDPALIPVGRITW
jgi:hypothetical protein